MKDPQTTKLQSVRINGKQPFHCGFVTCLRFSLFMSTTTWARDSHELFDYEARHVHKKSYELKRAAKVFRTTLEVQVVPDGQVLPAQSADYLLSVRERDGMLVAVKFFKSNAGRFSILPAEKNLPGVTGAPSLLPKKLWLIVKDLPSGNHQLQESDVIKLGRFKLKVKQLVRSGSALPVSFISLRLISLLIGITFG